MITQDGAKPQLKVVTDPYRQQLDEMLDTLRGWKAENKPINCKAALTQLDPDQDNSIVKNWLDANDYLTKSKFDSMMRLIQREKKIRDELGFVPQTASEFVNRYSEINNIGITPHGILKRKQAINVFGEAIDEKTAKTSAHHSCAYNVANSLDANITTYERDLLVVNADNSLGFRDSDIRHALSAWADKQKMDAVITMFLNVLYDPKAVPIADRMWNTIEEACFNLDDTPKGFATAVLKKFIWQVKRKGEGIEVTNHLMPVLTGAQGKGKSTFVQMLCKPVEDSKLEVDFARVTDKREGDIWKAHVLFLDEMQKADLADVNGIKNAITRPASPYRPMGTNINAIVKNNATFIGTTNDSLAQLIRDETGVRRFAELVYKLTPDWEALKSIDWEVLWRAVDPKDTDPMVTSNMLNHLVEQQQDNRTQHPVEVWARRFAKNYMTGVQAEDLHLTYREWEKDSFPAHCTSQDMFTKKMSNLIKNQDDFPWTKKRKTSGWYYFGER